MTMKAPCHPGEIIREEVLRPLGLSVTDAAKALAVAQPTLPNLLNENSSLTAEMALRIEKAFGPKMDHLMRMQLAYDLAQARKRAGAITVKRFRRRKARRAA
jgi:antitoxin HigA-1